MTDPKPDPKPEAKKPDPNLRRLVNLTPVAYPIVLDHPVFRARRYGFTVGMSPSIVSAPDGTRTREMVRRALPGSITLPPRGHVDDLHPAIVNVPQVAALLRRGAVRVEPMQAPKAEAAEQKAEAKSAATRKASQKKAEPKAGADPGGNAPGQGQSGG